MTGISANAGSAMVLVSAFLMRSSFSLSVALGDGEISFGGGHGGLILHDLHGRDVLQLKLFLIVRESLVGVRQRTLLDLGVLIGADEIPVDVFDLADGRDACALNPRSVSWRSCLAMCI